jgi:hypothetical protein
MASKGECSAQLFRILQRLRPSRQGPRRKRPHLGGVAPNRLRQDAGEPREGSMTLQISRRGKKYLETAQALLRAAQTMTDRAIAEQIKALADDYQRRAEKASHVDADKELAGSDGKAEGERWT